MYHVHFTQYVNILFVKNFSIIKNYCGGLLGKQNEKRGSKKNIKRGVKCLKIASLLINTPEYYKGILNSRRQCVEHSERYWKRGVNAPKTWVKTRTADPVSYS